MYTNHILQLLLEERDRITAEKEKLEKAISVMFENEEPSNPMPPIGQITSPVLLSMPSKQKRGQMSEKGKANIRAALARRHEAFKAAQQAKAAARLAHSKRMKQIWAQKRKKAS